MDFNRGEELEEVTSSPDHSEKSANGCIFSSRCSEYLYNTSKWPHRYIILALIGIIKIFNFYYGDVPASLEDRLISVLNIDTTQYNAINSVFEGANLFGCLLGGLFLGRLFGIHTGIITICGVTFLGQVLFAFGIFFDYYWLVLLGQFVLGSASQLVQIAATALVGFLFIGKELNFAFALLSSLDRLGGVLAFNTNDQIYGAFHAIAHSEHRLSAVLFVSSGYALVMFACAIFMALIDRRARGFTNKNFRNRGRFHFHDLKRIWSISLLLVILISALYYTSFFGLSYNGKVYFERKFGLSAHKANFANSLLYIIPAVLSPLFGLAIDVIGLNLHWTLCGISAAIVCNMILLLGSDVFSVYLALIIDGLSYSLVDTSLWPMTVLLVDKNVLASAYALQEAVLDVGFMLNNVVVGLIADHGGYLILQVFFSNIQFIALCLAILLYLVDTTRTKVLTTSRKKILKSCKIQCTSC